MFHSVAVSFHIALKCCLYSLYSTFFDATFLYYYICHLLSFVTFILLYFKVRIMSIRLILPLLLYTKILIATEVRYINYWHDIHYVIFLYRVTLV